MIKALLPIKLRLLNSKNGLPKVIEFLPIPGKMLVTNKIGNSPGGKTNALHSRLSMK
jgi:hypothetical protein